MTKTYFKEIFDSHFDMVRNYVYYRSGDTELATDIAQETFLRIWEKQLEPERDKTKALLFKIAGDLFVSAYRRQKTAMDFRMNLKADAVFETPEEQIKFKELKNNYEKALQRLPDKQRVVFLMSRMDGMKYHEIADALSLSVKAVEKRMKNALDHLRTVLKG